MTKLSLVLMLMLVLLPCATQAQISTGTLFGTVTDSSGSAISGANVTVQNLGTQTSRSTVTDSAGEWSIANLPAANYSISVVMVGFKTYNVPRIELQVAQRAPVNAVLELGAVQQELTVAATTPILETSSSSIGQVIDTKTVEHMPLNGRSFWQLTSLTPGATYTPGGQGTRTGGSSIRSSVVNVTINGAAANQTGWSLDGAFITEMQTGGTLIQPNVDSLQEFKVESANMEAQYGHTPNVVNATLKSGTNSLHGTLFEYLRNSVLDARNFFFIPPAGSSLKKDSLRRNQYGFTVGGPIVPNKTFFFADMEKTGLSQGINFNNVVPDAAMRNGDFSSLLRQSRPTRIVDPRTGTAFGGNLIPASQISPQGNFFKNYMPLPNTVQGSTSYASLANELQQHQTRGDIRIDQVLSSSTQLMGRYSINDNDESDPNAYPALGSFPLHSRAQNAVINLTHVFSPRWVADARAAYYRSIFLFGGTLEGTNFNQQAGVQGFNDTTSIFSFPQITLTGYSGFNGSPSDQRPKSNRIRNWQYAANLSYSSGRHSVKMGAELLHQTAGFFNGSRSVGIFNFSGIYSGNAFADFLLGYPDSVTRDYFKELNGDYADFWSGYVQDSFRVTPNFTLNAGLRFELNSFYSGIRGQKSAYDLADGKIIVPSSIDPAVQPLTGTLLNLFSDRIKFTNQLGLPSSIHDPEKDFAPRIGFAWTPPGSKMVVRSGYGIFYSFPDSNTINNTVATIPFIAAQTVFNDRLPLAPTRTWSDFFLGQSVVTANTTGQVCGFGFAARSCATPDVDSGSTRFRTTYMQQWNFSVQRQFGDKTSLDAAYIGTKTSHLNQNLTINDPAPGPGAIQARRPYPQWGSIVYPTFDENASYNALQVKFEQRAWHNMTGLLSYAYSKCIDYGSTQGGTTISLQRLNRGPCDYDLPHAFTGSFDYLLPFGRGQHFLGDARGLVNQLAGGWEITGIVTLRSGLPFTPTLSNDNANTGLGSQRPDVAGTPVIVGDPSCWFYTSANSSCVALAPGTTDAFVTPPRQSRYGTGGRNILRANGLHQVDLTILKTFPITESKLFEFRAEGFNVLNQATFAAPTTTINTTSGGQVSSTLNAARILQMSLRFRF